MKDLGVNLLASITIVAQVAVVLLLVGIVCSLASARMREALAPVRETIGRSGVWLAWGVSVVATAGSLWLSEGAGFVPCHLCWLQRYFMYPLVAVLIVVALVRRWQLTLAAILIPVVGMSISAWHVYVEANPSAATQGCRKGIPCSFKWVDEFGYITIPVMAGTAFVLIALLLGVAGVWQRRAAASAEG